MSQQSAGPPDRPGADPPRTMAAPGIPRTCVPPAGPPARRSGLGFGCPHACRWMAVCLCPSAWQEGRQPLLRAWFGCHCCQEKEAPSCQHNYLCFLHPPFLMWQLSAYRSAQCQGNRHGVGQGTAQQSVEPRGGGAGGPAVGGRKGNRWPQDALGC